MLGVCAGIAGGIFFVNPQLTMTALVAFTGPSKLFEFNPWYYALPFVGLVILVLSYGLYHWLDSRGRLMIWLFSIVYWGAWSVYWVADLKSLFDGWIVWAPHVAALLASIVGIYGLRVEKNGSVSVFR